MPLYFQLIGAKIRSQMQYRVSFWAEMLGFAMTTGLEFVAVLLLFSRFPSVAGWNVAEVALLYGLTSSAFGLAEMVGRGFDSPFEQMMYTGTFDTILTRPRGSFFQILASEFQLRRMGRVMQGWIVLGFAFAQLPIAWSWTTITLLVLTQCAGLLIYLSLIVISATLCFWTIKTPEVVNVFTFGGDFMVSYPQSIYSQPIRTVFTMVVPIAFVNYPTALTLLHKTDPNGFPPQLAWAAPVVAAAFFSLALAFWRFGVGKYTSSGT